MNCKPGDLAVYVGRDVDFLGRTMTVVCEYPEAFLCTGRVAWVVDPPMPSSLFSGMFATCLPCKATAWNTADLAKPHRSKQSLPPG